MSATNIGVRCKVSRAVAQNIIRTNLVRAVYELNRNSLADVADLLRRCIVAVVDWQKTRVLQGVRQARANRLPASAHWRL